MNHLTCMHSNKFRRQARRAGFSLAEIMVVIVIIGLLAALVVPNVLQRLGFAQAGTAKADIVTIAGALDEFAIQNGGRYPDSLEALVEKDSAGESILKLDVLPKDPWGNEYMYEAPGSGSSDARVITLGADGEPGGDGKNLDFDNIMIKNGEV